METTRFLMDCDPGQVRQAPQKFIAVAHKFSQIAVDMNQPLRAVQPLKSAISKLRPSPEHITPIHADFIQVCLLARTYKAALPVLEDEILDVDVNATATTPRDLLKYFYYGGMIYVGLKDYKRALEFFKLTFTAPAIILSAIMVEAYKKYVLVSLLVYGQVPPIPKYTSTIVQRHLKTSCHQYSEFAAAFSTHSHDELDKSSRTNRDAFYKDKNLGLVGQVIQSLFKRNIQRHTETFLTLSLKDIAESVHLASHKEAEKRILRMIEQGEIFATINQKDGMVSFHEFPEKYDNNRMLANIDNQIHNLINLSHKLTRVDEQIAISTHYLQKTAVSERHQRWGPGEMEDFMELGDKPPGFAGN